METQEEYRVTLTPKDMEPTLEELQALYQDYLQRGQELYKDLALIAQMLGKETTLPRRPEPWMIYDKGDTTAIFGVVTTAWNVGRNAWSIRQSLTVTIGRPVIDHIRETTVCRLSFQDGQLAGDDNIFVPGRWLEAVLKDLPKAKAIAGAQSSHDREARRVELANRLLIGKEV